ncbi:endonuclease/exonuclease/phosphatase family protein [Aliinostoc sp. HNIBRCY26]|uniref:endonuclease/exonuclease/phosphatase family protein n=1 Tax=Aliinostoc sp. HNIBRCY26 TaxID=3418997 RepID=UPI003CFDC9E2
MAKIIINEFYRGGNLTTGDEFIELLLLEDLTAAQLESFFVGDSTATKAAKFSAYDFTNMGSIAPVFQAGTIITIGGTTAFTQDTSYNPAGGDWNIRLNAGGAFLPNANSGNNGDIAGDDVVWVDTTNTGATISADGFAVDIGTVNGTFTNAVNVNFGSNTNNTGYALNSDATGVTNTANWITGIPIASTTPGQPNGGNNTTFINSLRSSVVIAAGVTITQSGNSTDVNEAGQTTDSYTIALKTAPTSPVDITITADGQTEVSVNGIDFSNSVTISLNNTNPATITVRAIDDANSEASPHTGVITHTINSSDPNYSNLTIPNLSVNITDNDVTPGNIRIHDIQGASHISPLLTSATDRVAVINVPGIVTVITSNGFYLQDPSPDDNIATSEGIFVFTGENSPLRTARTIGEAILVSGTVSEFRPGNNQVNLTVTQILNDSAVQSLNITPWTTAPTTNINPTVIGSDRTPPTTVINNDFTTPGNVETGGDFDPTVEGIDFYESLEGMLVEIPNPVAVSPTNNFGEIWVLANNGAGATGVNSRGGITISEGDFNPERIQIDDTLLTSTSPSVDTGTQFNNITGIVSYNFNNYEVLPTSPITIANPSTLQREVTNLTSTNPDQLTVASFNVENLDPSDGARFNSIAEIIVNNLKSPDIINLVEIQDNNGATNNGVVDADVTLQTLINAIASAGGPTYEFRQVNPENNQDGGEPGGNIRVGFLFNPNRVDFVDIPGGSPTTDTTVNNVNGNPELSSSPGRILDTDLSDGNAFANSRKPLVGEFLFNGNKVFVIANHFNSKGGDQPLFGRFQPPTLTSEVQRLQQAQELKNFVADILAVDPNANIVVAGDLNDFQFSAPLAVLESAGLTNLVNSLPVNERYSYNFDGNAQTLDHILVSNNLSTVAEFDIVHVNSEFANQVSDHDPLVARFYLPIIINGTTNADNLIGTDRNEVINGLAGNDFIAGQGGNDSINGGLGNGDRLFGGDGNDTIIDPDGVFGAHGGLGNDTINVNFAPTWDNNSNSQDAPRSDGKITGGYGDDIITITMNNSRFFLNLKGDEPVSNNTNDGNDIVTLLGSYANSAVDLGGGNDIFNGGVGSDSVSGGNGNDTLLGSNGNDLLVGGNGDDILNGGAGINILTGGQGSDIFVLSPLTGKDTIIDFNDGQDLIGLSGISFGQLTINSLLKTTFISWNDGNNNKLLAVLLGEDASNITAADFIEV